jgi:hypothetical protein
MGVDHPECVVLALHVGDDRRQHRVLQHVGEISGMVGVAVIHREC